MTYDDGKGAFTTWVDFNNNFFDDQGFVVGFLACEGGNVLGAAAQ